MVPKAHIKTVILWYYVVILNFVNHNFYRARGLFEAGLVRSRDARFWRDVFAYLLLYSSEGTSCTPPGASTETTAAESGA